MAPVNISRFPPSSEKLLSPGGSLRGPQVIGAKRVQGDTSLEHSLFLPVPVDTGKPGTFLQSPLSSHRWGAYARGPANLL